MPVTRVSDFNLALTLRSGQFFRYRATQDGWFEIVTHGRIFRARQEGDRLDVEGADAAFARAFFGLDDDLPALRAVLARDPVLRPALAQCRGLRILRQDPWECTLAFICSAWSNIPRITQNVEGLARAFGRRIEWNGGAAHALPRPGEVADAKRLRRIRLGFRARYVRAASETVSAAWLESLRRLPLHEARRAIRSIPGVGEKVAECILLFGLGFGEAFPVDVWIRRAMRRGWFPRRPVTNRALRDFAAERFGAHAGYAQQVLYVMARGENRR